MAHEPIPDPDGNGVLVDVGSPEGRRAFILERTIIAAAHHGDVRGAIECALTDMLEIFVAGLLEPANGQVNTQPSGDALIVAKAFVDHATINVHHLQLLGDAADLASLAMDDKPLPEEFASIQCAS